jgi:hypothetical protein
VLHGAFEWGVAVTMAAVVAVIGGWYAVQGLQRSTASTAPVGEVLSSAKELPPAPEASSTVSPRHRSALTWYRFEAARGDSWLQVRAGSPNARVLFEGVVAKGSAVRFRVRSLWVRFGSTNVNLRVAGERVRLPRMGTYDAYVGRDGVKRDPVLHPDIGQATAAQSP